MEISLGQLGLRAFVRVFGEIFYKLKFEHYSSIQTVSHGA